MKTNDKKAFFFDFDGTIWFGSFGEKTLKALNALHAKGHLLFYNSGRSKGNTRFDKTKEIPFDGFLFGGCHAEANGRIIFRSDISREIMSEVIALEKEYGLEICYEGAEGVYKRRGILPKYYGEELDDLSVLLDTEKYPMSKFSIIKKEVEGGYEPAPQEVLYRLSQYFDITDLNNYIEFMQKGTGKDFLAEKAINALGLDMDDVYAFGDSLNDLDMFELCKHNVAIGHSPSELKQRAEYVTTEELNGVYEALVHLGFVTEEECK